MALKREFTFLSGDGATQIHGIEWKPESGKICGILQIFHGMVEYIERYEDFAEFLTEKGFLVVGNDHLGHGKSVKTKEEYGFFAEKDGNKIVLGDLHRLYWKTAKKHPGVPYYILGHSMGSFLLRQYLFRYHHGNGNPAGRSAEAGESPVFRDWSIPGLALSEPAGGRYGLRRV